MNHQPPPQGGGRNQWGGTPNSAPPKLKTPVYKVQLKLINQNKKVKKETGILTVLGTMMCNLRRKGRMKSGKIYKRRMS